VRTFLLGLAIIICGRIFTPILCILELDSECMSYHKIFVAGKKKGQVVSVSGWWFVEGKSVSTVLF